jgi:protein-S-isoprenylcysteine O-methyltransferase Ste14
MSDSLGRDLEVSGSPRVIARPIRLFPAALLIGFGLDHLLPIPLLLSKTGVARSIGVVIAGALILAGIALFAAGTRNFSRAATPIPTNQPARVLVTTGIHGRTRNPIYLGFFLMYVGIGIGALSAWTLALTVPIAIAVRYGVVAREEAYLEQRFGDAYSAYKARVRRWV